MGEQSFAPAPNKALKMLGGSPVRRTRGCLGASSCLAHEKTDQCRLTFEKRGVILPNLLGIMIGHNRDTYSIPLTSYNGMGSGYASWLMLVPDLSASY